MEPKFKIGDEVKIIKSNCIFYNFKAIIKKVDDYDSYLPYLCNIIDNENKVIGIEWLSEKSLILLKNSKKYFTISIKKHKRINLKFAL